ncbi:MAG: signal peptidase I [Armatimonadota bacterium]|nr:signal peptidase I [Armatimonadota bacterium]MDR7402652.1 signal peptidase I [Armatimonadota bacterium]MDR7404892.1 signal peptidase I [Armatimonadota bacterium]MDR7436746.1 signal peptidase I [Armatimonadota bacterium]MDR7472693.1 signal peptidase I [Armatimonadota bacterium]
MPLGLLDRLPLSIPTLILLLTIALVVARLLVRRAYVIPPAWRASLLETLDASIVAAGLSLLIITFVVQAFFIPSGSMEPTLQVGDRILVAKFAYRLSPIRRGDVIVFHYPLNPGKDFVKRVVALGGETVELRDGVVLINDTPVTQLSAPEADDAGRACTTNYGPQTVPRGYLFVLGDNRCNSEDSRFFGFVPEQNVVGRALFIYWPPQRIGLVR